jgi:hypothetical protein
MKRLIVFSIILTGAFSLLQAQNFSFNMPNHHFMLIPGGGFESRVWVTVGAGDSVTLKAYPGPGLVAFFQPSVVRGSQFAYLVVVSTAATLPVTQSLRVSALHGGDSISQMIQVDDANDGSGYYLIDSARYYFDTAFAWLRMVHPGQAQQLSMVENLPWIACFPYPPLWIVTHHLFVSGNWRVRVLWHNMIPPDDWARVFISNEELGITWAINMDSYRVISEIPYESMHYVFQDTLTSFPDVSGKREYLLFPNPCSAQVELILSEPSPESCMAQLYNLGGQLLRVCAIDAGQQSVSIDMSSYPDGFYLLRAGNQVMRFIKQ